MVYEERNKSKVSRYIREALDAGVMRPFDEKASRKLMKYLPFWAWGPPTVPVQVDADRR